MIDKDSSGMSRWSRRKAAHRKQDPRSRGPKITYADDVEHYEEPEPLKPQDLQKPSVSNIPVVAAVAPESSFDDADDLNGEQVDDSPEALDKLAGEHDLAPLGSLNIDSDFRPYMQNGIPDMLKQAAMRRLWRIDPAFGFLDGMNEYDENFRVIDKLITAMDTSYKVGRGYLDDEDDEEVDNAEEVGEDAPSDPKHELVQPETEVAESDIDDIVDAGDLDDDGDLDSDV
jgi:hypothetical protein